MLATSCTSRTKEVTCFLGMSGRRVSRLAGRANRAQEGGFVVDAPTDGSERSTTSKFLIEWQNMQRLMHQGDVDRAFDCVLDGVSAQKADEETDSRVRKVGKMGLHWLCPGADSVGYTFPHLFFVFTGLAL